MGCWAGTAPHSSTARPRSGFFAHLPLSFSHSRPRRRRRRTCSTFLYHVAPLTSSLHVLSWCASARRISGHRRRPCSDVQHPHHIAQLQRSREGGGGRPLSLLAVVLCWCAARDLDGGPPPFGLVRLQRRGHAVAKATAGLWDAK